MTERSKREPRTPMGDDQMVGQAVPKKNINKGDLDRFGIFAFPIKLYYRYTVMTGIYMLGTVETGILHLAYVLGFFFLYTYVWTFVRELEFWFTLGLLTKK